jgi:hypothetical protein
MADPCSPLQVDTTTDEIYYLQFLYCLAAGIKRGPAVYPVDLHGNGVIKPPCGRKAL